MANGLHTITPMPAFRLLSNGGPSTAFQLAKIATTTKLFAIPGIDPVLLAGPLVSWIVAVLEGAVVIGGLSAIGAGLASIGIPRRSVIEYETALQTNKFLLIVHGTRHEVSKAKDIIGKTQPSFHTVHGERVFAH